MPKEIAVFPEEIGPRIQDITLSDVLFRLRLRWIERASGWYADLYDADNNLLAGGRRLAGNSTLIRPLVIEGAPAGALVCLGDGEGDRAALGTSLRLYYVTPEEIAANTSSSDLEIS